MEKFQRLSTLIYAHFRLNVGNNGVWRRNKRRLQEIQQQDGLKPDTGQEQI